MEHGTHRRLVLMSSMAQAHLLFPDGTVTGRFTNVLFHEASAKHLENALNPPIALQSINREAHSTAIHRTSVPHTHVVNLLHQAYKFDSRNQCVCVVRIAQ